MQPPEPPTKLEMDILPAYQMVGQIRLQTTLMHEGTIKCIDKCMDKDDLFSLDRSHMPISQRLKLDEKERTCVKNCSAKWDEIFRRESQRLMRGEQDFHMIDMMRQQMEMMAGGGASGGGAPPGGH